jgi:hypothetical protein
MLLLNSVLQERALTCLEVNTEKTKFMNMRQDQIHESHNLSSGLCKVIHQFRMPQNLRMLTFKNLNMI